MTTAETMLNARTVRDWMLKSIPGAASVDVIRQQFIACRSCDVLSFITFITPLFRHIDLFPWQHFACISPKLDLTQQSVLFESLNK
jgi:hypothetical protein